MPFEFTSPDSVQDALALEREREGARYFAGGTDLIPEIKIELAAPTRLVNLKQIPNLRGIQVETEGLRIGALTTLTEVAQSDLIRHEYRALAQACAESASPQIRNTATIGGNLCQDSRCPYYRGEFDCYLKGGVKCFMRDGENRGAAVIGYHDCVHVHPSDPANALVAFDAEILVRGVSGERRVPAAEFFHAPQGDDRRMTVLQAGELIEAIWLPRVSADTRSIYLKAMDRATWTFALASAAVRLDMDDGKIAAARIVVGAVAPVPWRLAASEEALRGHQLDENLAVRAAEMLLQDAIPLAHNAYKIRLARALVKRALRELA